jgi:hypothetical protein
LEKCRPAIALTPDVPRPRPIEDAANQNYGSLDEIFFGAAPTYRTSSEPIVAAQGTVFHVRGWLARIDATRLRSTVEVRIDGSRISGGHAGEPRPDVPKYMRERFKRDGYRSDVGFTIPVATTGLQRGPHRLEIITREADGAIDALTPDFPFTIY